MVYLNHRKDDSNVQMKFWKPNQKVFKKRIEWPSAEKSFLNKLLEEVQEKGKPTKLVNGDTKASVSEEREVEIC